MMNKNLKTTKSNDERLIGLYNEKELQETIKEGRYLAGVDDGIE